MQGMYSTLIVNSPCYRYIFGFFYNYYQLQTATLGLSRNYKMQYVNVRFCGIAVLQIALGNGKSRSLSRPSPENT